MKNLIIVLLSLFTITLHAQHMKNTQEFINQLFIAADQHNWQIVEQSFASRVTLDYSSMTGTPANEVSPKQIIDSWKGILPGFDYTHHQVSNFIIEQNDTNAKIFCYGTATHYLENEKENLWTVVGSYDFNLKKKEEKWLITEMRFNFKYQSGNIALSQLAIKN
ncbi:nuclear transport factor 2 family protein [Aquimarina sp. MMG016]|uniref:nuclear transport factor 2 family protein n=1 Tax=Aquimarina sp. MMG016 TaxID=2822690 RepID=UPI001B39DDE5|nr:nuclear transport factor 2 family protein [Aquimarina sp. MMG016]MBQ4821940.1 nuclear transport factor 2 family protein [Aquimarina sp. MMG016]